jgi:HSP20 family molecular chaperone IbpA
VKVENGVLCISLETEEEIKEEKKNYCRREYSCNGFSHSFTLPENSLLIKSVQSMKMVF